MPQRNNLILFFCRFISFFFAFFFFRARFLSCSVHGFLRLLTSGLLLFSSSHCAACLLVKCKKQFILACKLIKRDIGLGTPVLVFILIRLPLSCNCSLSLAFVRLHHAVIILLLRFAQRPTIQPVKHTLTQNKLRVLSVLACSNPIHLILL